MHGIGSYDVGNINDQQYVMLGTSDTTPNTDVGNT